MEIPLKKKQLGYDLDTTPYNDDYKMLHVMGEDKKNFESTDKWLYLGADIENKGYAKIGITTGDLRSRSYSSANPNYYLFCAFKFRYNVPQNVLKQVESEILEKFDQDYTYHDGSTKRKKHVESGYLSECYYNIDFIDFFQNLHYELFYNYAHNFCKCGFEDEYGNYVGDFIDCLFNEKIFTRAEINDHISLILQPN